METKKLQRFLDTVPTELDHPKLTYRNVRYDFKQMLQGADCPQSPKGLNTENIAYSWHAEYRGLLLGWIVKRLSRKNLPKYQREYLDQLHVLLITVHITED